MFDMDNTLLESRINFKGMRNDLINLLVSHQVGTFHTYEHDVTAAQVIEKGKKLLRNDDQLLMKLEKAMYEIVVDYEREGMKEARLEDGVRAALQGLKKKGLVLAVVTNNAHAAACLALKRQGILDYFDLVVGREQMEALKPSPSGVKEVIKSCPHVTRWVMVGDSWIDGKAAQQAGVDFVAFQTESSLMHRHGVYPVASVRDFKELMRWMERWVCSSTPSRQKGRKADDSITREG
jgi:phosphoglycolate phosphatase